MFKMWNDWYDIIIVISRVSHQYFLNHETTFKSAIGKLTVAHRVKQNEIEGVKDVCLQQKLKTVLKETHVINQMVKQDFFVANQAKRAKRRKSG